MKLPSAKSPTTIRRRKTTAAMYLYSRRISVVLNWYETDLPVRSRAASHLQCVCWAPPCRSVVPRTSRSSRSTGSEQTCRQPYTQARTPCAPAPLALHAVQVRVVPHMLKPICILLDPLLRIVQHIK